MKATVVNKSRFIISITTFSFALLFGIVFLTLFLNFKKEVPENYVETKAKIIRIEEELSPAYDETDGIDDSDYEHSVFVEYSYNGKTYTEKEYSNYNSDMKKGDSVVLYLNPDAPEEFISDPSDNFIFIIVGIVIILIGIGGLGYNIYKKKKGE